jgi:hypothetical protein
MGALNRRLYDFALPVKGKAFHAQSDNDGACSCAAVNTILIYDPSALSNKGHNKQWYITWGQSTAHLAA